VETAPRHPKLAPGSKVPAGVDNSGPIGHCQGPKSSYVPIGRDGMHRYNKMDHSMYTGILAAENVLGGRHDVWNVNDGDTYLG
jgi:hypothetical protein